MFAGGRTENKILSLKQGHLMDRHWGKTERIFELLDRLGELDDAQLMDHFTDDTVSNLRLLAVQLNENMRLEKVLSEKRYIEVVRQLVGMRKIWSGKLDEVQGYVEQAMGKGGKDQALWLLNGYIRFCPSPYFRAEAEKILEESKGT
jgi:hypothetical protein